MEREREGVYDKKKTVNQRNQNDENKISFKHKTWNFMIYLAIFCTLAPTTDRS